MIPFSHAITIIALVALGTFFTRAVPFLIWGGKHSMPEGIQGVAEKLPPAIMAILVIYCLKDATFSGGTLLPSLIAIAVIIVLHLWKRNLLLSMAVGTILYMYLLRVM